MRGGDDRVEGWSLTDSGRASSANQDEIEAFPGNLPFAKVSPDPRGSRCSDNSGRKNRSNPNG